MIFCVEDDDNIRELVIYTLETTGLEARGFADGTAFMTRQSLFCLILCFHGKMDLRFLRN